MSLPLSVRMNRHAVRWSRTLRRVFRGTGTTYVGERVSQYREYWTTAAEALGAELHDLTDSVWEVRRGAQSTRVTNYVVPLGNSVVNTLAGDKPYGYSLAAEAGVPVARHGVFDLSRLDDAQAFARTLDGPLVVKPARGTSSAIGITTGVRPGGALNRAACLASLFCDEWIVEAMHFGHSCRLLLLDGELLHAVRRNENPGTPREVHPVTERRTVYDEEITADVHPGNVAAALGIATRFGVRFSGVDFITPDISRPLADNGGVFIELNTTPGIHHHDIGGGERPLPVAVRVLATLLDEAPAGSESKYDALQTKETP